MPCERLALRLCQTKDVACAPRVVAEGMRTFLRMQSISDVSPNILGWVRTLLVIAIVSPISDIDEQVNEHRLFQN